MPMMSPMPAASDLGLGGLTDQVAAETEEERKKRQQQQQQARLLGQTPGISALGMGLGDRAYG